MCELLDSMVNKGLQQGLKEGRQEGLQQGIRQGIQILITTYKEFGMAYETASARVKEKYALNDAEVQRDMELYW